MSDLLDSLAEMPFLVQIMMFALMIIVVWTFFMILFSFLWSVFGLLRDATMSIIEKSWR